MLSTKAKTLIILLECKDDTSMIKKKGRELCVHVCDGKKGWGVGGANLAVKILCFRLDYIQYLMDTCSGSEPLSRIILVLQVN